MFCFGRFKVKLENVLTPMKSEYAFQNAFPREKDPITIDNIAKAIGAFGRILVTPAPFDAFIKGEQFPTIADGEVSYAPDRIFMEQSKVLPPIYLGLIVHTAAVY